MPKKNTIKEFIDKSIKIHGNKYDYSMVEYKGCCTKIKIICNEHGVFNQMPYSHLHNRGCPKCAINTIKQKLSSNKEEFIIKSKNIHNCNYDYSLVNYKNNMTKVDIICTEHGVFKQKPNNHLLGQKCPKCAQIERNKNKIYDNKIFIDKSVKIHGDRYDYNCTKYVNSHTKVTIICKIHGKFSQYPKHHYNGIGCPTCKLSKGELEIQKFLEKNNIEYISQYKFKNCIDKKPLPFDFYLPKYNICIEYDGQQHFKPFWSDVDGSNFCVTKKHDNIKNEYCFDNNISLFRINFIDKNNINNILTQKFLSWGDDILYNCNS